MLQYFLFIFNFFKIKTLNTSLQHFRTALKPSMQGPIKAIKMERLWFGSRIQAKGELQEKESTVGGRQDAAVLKCDRIADF